MRLRQARRMLWPMGVSIAIASVPVAAVSRAQEGYPLDGAWLGQLSGGFESPPTIGLIMKWNGEDIDGMIGPKG